MTKFRKFIKDISNLKDAFRVLEIMDYIGGVDIEKLQKEIERQTNSN